MASLQFVTGIRQYFRDVRSELKKVVWPGRPELVASTIVVLVTVLFFSLYIGGLDAVFSEAIHLVARAFGGSGI